MIIIEVFPTEMAFTMHTIKRLYSQMICGMSVQIITSVEDLLAAWIIAGKTLVLHGLLNKPIKAQKGRLKPINVAFRGWEGHERKREWGGVRRSS